MLKRRANNILSSGIWVYAIITFVQWVSYAAIFKILLEGTENSTIRAALYIALLAFIRAISSIGLGRKRLMGRPSITIIILVLSIGITGFQVYFAQANLINIFLLLTGLKLGALTMFQVWRDILSSKLSRLGVHTSHRANSLFFAIDFGALALGAFSGGLLTGWLGPANMIWVDAPILLIALILFICRGYKAQTRLSHYQFAKHSSGLRPVGLLGHSLRAISDAGFQGILPIVAYQVIHISAPIFGLSISISGLLIALGAKAAVLVSNKSFQGRQKYASFCFITTLINAASLWLCFNSSNVSLFLFWLGVASLSSGMALVASKTIVISELQHSVSSLAFDASFYFTPIRWFGIFLGALFLAWGLSLSTWNVMASIYLSIMAFSGGLMWLGAFENTNKTFAIGKRIREILLGTFVILICIVCVTSYFSFLEYPKKHRTESMKAALMPYFNLVDMNMRISDLSEVIRLTRTFEFPRGIVSSRISIRDSKKIIFEDVFNNQISQQINTELSQNIPFDLNKIFIQKKNIGYFSDVYLYRYLLKYGGPQDQALLVTVAIDDTSYYLSDLYNVIMIILAISVFLIVVYFVLRQMTSNLLKPLNNISEYLKGVAKENIASEKPIRCPEYLSGQSLEIQEVIHAFNNVANELERSKQHIAQTAAFTSIGRVAAWVAHDIRKPWALVRAFLSMISDHLNDEMFLKRAEEDIQNTLRKVECRIDDILTLTRGDSKKRHFQSYDHIQAFKETHTEFQKINEGLSIVVEYDVQDSRMIYVVPEYMDRVFENLLHNAINAIPSSGKIIYRSRLENHYMRIDIIDDGPGISTEVVEHIDNPFGSSKTSAGLGLSICKKFVQDMNGIFSIHPLSKIGTQVTLLLPPAKERKLCVLEDEYLQWKELSITLGEVGIQSKDLIWADSIDAAVNRVQEGCSHLIADMDLYGNPRAGLEAVKRCLKINADLHVLICSTYLSLDQEDTKDLTTSIEFHQKPIPKQVLSNWFNPKSN